jgi:flagellar protein FliS
MERRLIESNRGNDMSLLDEVSDLLKQIKEAWDAIAGHAATHHEPAA